MTHGDFWVNNMLFSSDDPNDPTLTVTMIDFQLMTLCHPGRDLWYLLYDNVDREFRAKHLHTVLKEYFIVLSGYLKQGGLAMSFQEFMDEINKIRAGTALVFSSMVLCIGLNPVPLSFATMSDTNHVVETFKQQLGNPPQESDDPMVKEIRRRLLGTILELDEEGFLQ